MRIFAGICVPVALAAAAALADLRSDILSLTHGLRVKMVWAKDSSLVCFDTDEGKIRTLLIKKDVNILAYPLISADGRKVIFASNANRICMLDWTDSNKTAYREICDGICPEASWRDTATGRIWVFYSQKLGSDKRYSYFRRFRLDDPSVDELVWDKTNADVPFSLSADGKYGACQFPWPYTGIAEFQYRSDGSIIPNGTYLMANKNGCNSNILPDNSYRMFHVNLGTISWKGVNYANHHGIWMYDSLLKGQREPYTFIPLSIGIKPFSRVRITNHPRYFAYYGPEEEIQDVYVARFDSAYSSIDGTVRLTDTPDSNDAGPYAWLLIDDMVPDPDTVSFSAPVGGGDPASQSVRILRRDTANHLPELAVSSDRPWCRAAVAGAGDAQTVTVSIAAAGMNCGIFTAYVTVRGSGLQNAFVQVVLRVTGCEKTLDAIRVRPGMCTVKPGGAVRFSAVPLNVYHEVLSVPVVWSASGGGAIDDFGLFRAGTAAGTFAVIATAAADTAKKGFATAVVAYSAPDTGDSMRVLYPNGGEIFSIGDTMPIAWRGGKTTFTGAVIELSTDRGLTWMQINNDSGMSVTDPRWGFCAWKVPSQLFNPDAGTGGAMVPTASGACLLRLRDYTDKNLSDRSDAVFTIVPLSALTVQPRTVPGSTPRLQVRSIRGSAAIDVGIGGDYLISLVSLQGKTLFSMRGSEPRTFIVPPSVLGRGMYFVRVTAAGQPLTQRLIVAE